VDLFMRGVQVGAPTGSEGLRPPGWHSVEEARKLLAAIRDTPRGALWTLLLMLGLRRSEACGLLWDDVDFAARTLRITRSVQRVDGKLREFPTKTRRSNRTVPLLGRCIEALAECERSGNSPGAVIK
jgi:integrase